MVLAVIDGLDQIFNKDQYANKVIENLLKRDKRWGARDRAFIAETTYEIVRWKRLYATIAEVKPPFSRKDLWRMFAVWAVLRGIRLPPWKELAGTPERRVKGRFDEYSKKRVYRESIPDWLDALGVKELGEKRWERELHALNQQAAVVLRANTLKTSPRLLVNELFREGVEASLLKGHPDAVILKRRVNVFQTQAFAYGLFEIQDASSQQVSPFLQPEPGMRVVDACAGAGGKTLHLAALMKNKGQVIAMDVHKNKLYELRRRARRNGAHNIEPRWIENNKVIKRLEAAADAVLIDAPCSGLGVLRRNPETKWKLSPEFLDEVRETQRQILSRYSSMVKPGGKLVYATCSILPSENKAQVDRFLSSERGKPFTLVKDTILWPSSTGFDGFYMAMLQKNRS